MIDIRMAEMASETGRWVGVPGYPGVALRIRLIVPGEIEKLKQRCRTDGVLDPERYRVGLEDLLGSSVLDWRGVADGGAEIPYSRDALKRLLASLGGLRIKGPDGQESRLATWLVERANEPDEFLSADLAEAEKN